MTQWNAPTSQTLWFMPTAITTRPSSSAPIASAQLPPLAKACPTPTIQQAEHHQNPKQDVEPQQLAGHAYPEEQPQDHGQDATDTQNDRGNSDQHSSKTP